MRQRGVEDVLAVYELFIDAVIGRLQARKHTRGLVIRWPGCVRD